MKIEIKSSGVTLTFEYPIEKLFGHLPPEQQVEAQKVISKNIQYVLEDFASFLVGSMRSGALNVAILVVLGQKISEASAIALQLNKAVLDGKNPVDVYTEFCKQYLKDLAKQFGVEKEFEMDQPKERLNSPFQDFIQSLDLTNLDNSENPQP